MDSAVLTISGDDVLQGPILRVKAGRILFDRSPDVNDGQKFVAKWSECEASLSLLSSLREGGLRGGSLLASPITGKV